jgi:TonB dependent receptor/Carboxypeptidase regulatory-like domain
MKRTWLDVRNPLTLALMLAIGAQNAVAQSSVGSIFGQAEPEATVTIENVGSGAHREITADKSGKFSFSQLPTGSYKVVSGGKTQEVNVNAGGGTNVDLSTKALEEVVVRAGAINPIDVSSVESATIFTSKQIDRLPLPRNVTNVALLAPGTVKGDVGFGNLASFGGSSVAENGYYVNGFDVTNIRNFLSYANLPFEAIGEQQIKTGGYGAEYGRSLGGVISLVSKRGTNEWKSGASLYWQPQGLSSAGKDVVNRDPSAVAAGNRFFQYRSDNTATNFSVNVFAGGPLIEDRLFLFALVEGHSDTINTYRREDSDRQVDKAPNGLVKLDWNISDSHILEFTGIQNKQVSKYQSFDNGAGGNYAGQFVDPTGTFQIDNGGQVYIGKYTGYLSDTFTLSAMAGRINSVNNYQTPDPRPGGECPNAFDSRANAATLTYIGCWQFVNNALATIRTPGFGPNKDTRNAFRIDGEWRVGDHQIRFGYDGEKFESSAAGTSYSGGRYYRYFRTGATPRTVNGVSVAPNTDYVRVRTRDTSPGSYEVKNTALYLEDNWQLADNFLLYAGLRSEAFENFNGDGDKFVDAKNSIAPRLGFSWDVNSDSSLKVFANAGRYYIPVASNTNVRASGWEETTERFFYYSGNFDPRTAVPVGLAAQIGPSNIAGSRVAPNPGTVAATNLKPMYQDEFIFGTQKQIGDGWSVGARAIFRKVRNGFDDFCGHQAFLDWAADNGFNNFTDDTLAQCLIVNPGRDLQVDVDVNNDGNLRNVTIPARYLGLPNYQRKYSALELFWERASQDGLNVQGSYTYAKSRGNVEGYVNSTLVQTDAGLTQDFDYAVFENGAYGPLPNDRTHTIKLFGSYDVTDEWGVGGNLLVQSGRPINCNGFAPLGGLGVDAGSVNLYAGSSFYCPDSSGATVLGNRGDRGRTPWIYSLDASLSYRPHWAEDKLLVKVDVLNLFNTQRVTQYSEAAQSTRGNTSLNFLNDATYQAPRSVLFTLRYTF